MIRQTSAPLARLAALLPAVGLLAACGSGFEGTWLIEVDPNSATIEGTCAPDEPDPTEYIGTNAGWIDILRIGDDRYAVDGGTDTVLLGTADGAELTASWEQGTISDGVTELTRREIRITRDGQTISGEIEISESTEGDGDPENCTQTSSFTGARALVNDDEFLDDVED